MMSVSESDSKLESPYRTVKEAAKFLRLRPQTLNNMRTAGRGPSYYKHGSRIVYHIDELISWSQLSRRDLQARQREFAF